MPDTPLDPRERAAHEQRSASDPLVSAFVAASAGSGKTKVLTDRLLRLMLDNEAHPLDPGRIQCLTFTKAAAAEMAVRLQKRLGEWVTLDDDALDDDLRSLSLAATPSRRQAARALFARVLDLPGGMRIGTIHAFCEALLRRFPLEANLSPHFRLIEETDAAAAMQSAQEDMLADPAETRRAALESLAGLVSLGDFGQLVRGLMTDRERLARVLVLAPGDFAPILDRVVGADRRQGPQEAARWPFAGLREALSIVATAGSPKVAERAVEMAAWLDLDAADRAENWAAWRSLFTTKAGEPCAASTLLNKKLADQRPGLMDVLLAEQQRILSVEDNWRAIKVADLTAALLQLAGPVIASYARRKDALGQLDFDDLIARTSGLLVDPGAAWVLYKLDGGIDHLLLDEVQDTAPAQWHIAAALTAEFFAGQGAAKVAPRTVFAVGDRKQSIYSFQGADPDAFEHWRGILSARAIRAGELWRDVALDVSFRSTAPVLALVDAVFVPPEAASGVTEPGRLTHYADRAGHAGRVELWPLVPVPDRAAPEPWQVPDRNLGETSAMQRLADGLAEWIAAQTGGGVMLESRGRMLRPGDVLVLVRRRNAFARSLVRALKARGVPVAGIDRMVLTDQPAVADLLALCDALLLPEDDLSLACVLTSPIGGLTDDSMMALAMRRTGTLWDALRHRAGERADWGRAADLFARLLARVDYASPYALLAEALGPLGGRARLFVRLGPEAAEPVDELLQAALVDERTHPPSLQGFLQRLRGAASEVKREAEGAGSLVRVMTVHGAKGLQAPLVILPDTTSLPPDDGPLSWGEDAATGIALPVWSPRKELRCAAAASLRLAAANRRAEEQNRLLYVALTRAEDRLVVCGWETNRKLSPSCWYEQVKAGFSRLDAVAAPVVVKQPWPGDVLAVSSEQTRPAEAARTDAAFEAPAALPAWAGAPPSWAPLPPPPEPALPEPLAPSRPLDAELGPVPSAASPLAARDATGRRFARGKLVHTLLQHLPALPEPERGAAARRFLARPGHGMNAAEIDDLADEVTAVLAHPALSALFGTDGRAEVPLTGVIDGVVIGGLVDRVAVLPDRVLIADYKTNRSRPARAEDVPVLYLRQLAAYRAVLRSVFPDRPVSCALVWTAGPDVMPLPDTLLDRHAPGARAAA